MTPFVLYARPLNENGGNDDDYHVDANVTRYCDILSSIETLIKVSERCFASSVQDICFRLSVIDLIANCTFL